MPEHKYGIHSIFGPTIQGEGTLAGTPCIFIRFSGCNMWDGRPETRADSKCPFCDTDFFSHSMMTSSEVSIELVRRAAAFSVGWVWISGGEPMLQIDVDLLQTISNAGFRIGVETNGTVKPKPNVRSFISHLVVSPKQTWDNMKIKEADTLKLLYPHPNPRITPEAFSSFSARNRFLQPIWPNHGEPPQEFFSYRNVDKTVEKLFHLPGWRLSTQTHKYIGVE